ncbi:MAG TPA: hypothetical protein VF033_16950 [Steroidobacteraceae bacterium]|jgi:hypothetical protein
MTSPLDRAKLLDAEMQLQRAWLEINLRELQAPAHSSPWAKLQALNRTFNAGHIGLSMLKHRSLWLAAASLLLNVYRRHARRDSRH